MVDTPHNRHAPAPHYYLFFIGVDPAFRGKGHAGRLIRPVLARLDEKKLACYLNTQNVKNTSLYEHFGFRVAGQLTMPGSGITCTGMMRTPMETV
jgi:ribosomal protein S18 acetylase RimI-like enzyme